MNLLLEEDLGNDIRAPASARPERRAGRIEAGFRR
jgi:hypothetical protein